MIIRADTDQLCAVARQMRTTADQITGGHDGMRQSMDSLDATWSGHARDRGMARWGEIAPKYRPSADGLVHLANELEALAQRLDDAAAVFGAGGG
ncbi:MAG: WXG100 family type VII secretion target, partial [Oscillochloris sp.]|nr:WXG100 family type VII secretion target [Oscillochloris sp.]